MVTIFTRPNSPFFWIRYKPEGQSLKRESTGISHSGRQQPAKESPVWDLVHQIEARLMRSRYGMAPELQQKTIDDFINEYIASLSDYEQSTRETRNSYLKKWASWCHENGISMIAAVNADTMTAYVDYLKLNNAPLTVRNKITVLRLALDEARRRNYMMLENPLAGVKIRRPKGKPRDGFTDEELRTLRGMSDPAYLRMAVEISLWTGCRCNSLFHLRWDHVDFEKGVIYVNRSKTGEYFVPMSDELSKALIDWRAAEWAEGRGKADELVLMRLAGRSRNYISVQFGYHRVRLGLTRGSFHWLRHTLPGRLHLAGVPLDVRQKILNHKSEAVHREYLHLEASQLRQYVNQVKFG